jgi:hypothetical protein
MEHTHTLGSEHFVHERPLPSKPLLHVHLLVSETDPTSHAVRVAFESQDWNEHGLQFPIFPNRSVSK